MDNATQQPDEQTESQGAVDATTPASNQTRRRKRDPHTGQFVTDTPTTAATDADAAATLKKRQAYTTPGCGDTLWCNPPRPATARDFTYQLMTKLCGDFESLHNKLKGEEGALSEFLTFKANAAMGVISAFLESRLPAGESYTLLAGLFREMLVATTSAAGIFTPMQGTGGSVVDDIGSGLNLLCQTLDAHEQGDPSRTHFMQLALESPQFANCLGQIDALLDTQQPFLPSVHLNEGSPLRTILTALMDLSSDIAEKAKVAAYSCDDEEICESYRIICEGLGKIDEELTEFECQVDHLACTLVEPPLVMNVRTGLAQASYFLANMVAAFQGIVLPAANPMAQMHADWSKIASQIGEVQKATGNWAATQLCPPPNFCKESTSQILGYTHEALKVVDMLACDPNSQAAWDRLGELATKTQGDLITLYSQVASVPDYQWHVFDPFWRPLSRIQMALSACEAVDDDCADTQRQLACFFQYMNELRNSVVGIDCECDEPCTALPATRSRRIAARAYARQPAGVEAAKTAPIANVVCTPEQWLKLEEYATQFQPYMAKEWAAHTGAQLSTIRNAQQVLKSAAATGQPLTPAQAQMAGQINEEYARLDAICKATIASSSGQFKAKLKALGERYLLPTPSL